MSVEEDTTGCASMLVREALATGIALRADEEFKCQATEDAGVWLAGHSIDTSAAADTLERLLSYRPFVESLARHTETVTWVNIFQRDGADAPPREEIDLRNHLGLELWERLEGLAESVVGLPKEGPLAGNEWELDSYGFVLAAPGTPPQGLHIDYDEHQHVALIQLNGNTDPRATTQYMIFEGGEEIAQKIIDAGNASERGYVDIDRLLLDASVMEGLEEGMQPLRVTVKRGPREAHRPYILKAGTLHRGTGNPKGAEYRIAFTVSFMAKGVPPLARESIWETDDP